jgi:tRNA(Ile)-lysidine synthase
VKRQEILDFLASRNLTYQTDSTNLDCSISRNRLRHRVLPVLEQQFNPSLIDTLARTTELLRDEEEWMDGEARRALARMPESRDENKLRLPVGQLASLPPALARRVIRLAVAEVKGDLRAWSVRHVNQVLQLTAPGKSGRRLMLPGIECYRSFDDLFILPTAGGRKGGNGIKPELEAQGGYNGYEYEYRLPVPGRLEIPEAGGVIETVESMTSRLPSASGSSVVVGLPGAASGQEGLKVRNLRPGDRFRGLGAPGTKSLSRYLMEHRVERQRRREIPLVVRGEREVLWVVGHGVSELSRVGPGTSRRLHLTWVER